MTLTDLATKSGTSLSTVRELAHNLSTRRRQPRTLAAVSIALGWPSGHLAAVLHGDQPPGDENPDTNPVLAELQDMHELLRKMNDRLDHLEEKIQRDKAP